MEKKSQLIEVAERVIAMSPKEHEKRIEALVKEFARRREKQGARSSPRD